MFIWLLYGSLSCWAQPIIVDTPSTQGSEVRSTAPKQSPIVVQSSNPDLALSSFLRGVRFAIIEMSAAEQLMVDNKGSVFLKNFSDYLKAIGLEQVAYTTEDKKELQAISPSLCDIVKVHIQSSLLKDVFIDHNMRFASCIGDTFSFSSDERIYNDQFLIDKMFTLWELMYNQKMSYNENYRLRLQSHPTDWQHDDLMAHLTVSTDPLEGIYERLLLGNSNNKTRYTIALVKNKSNTGYIALYISGAENPKDWLPYELIAEITPSATQNLFTAKWYLPNKTVDDDVYMSVDAMSLLHFSFTRGEQETWKYFKTFPKQNVSPINPIATGSGVAISSSGYIVTNYHVVEGGSVFEVQGKQNGMMKTYNATLVKQDVASDLAILKINSFDFKGLADIPYSLKTTLAAKGEEVFTLGFPLTKQLGSEVKYTKGNISAESGYQGDVSCYQTSVSVHPGNSGGGLFDTKGNLVGFVRAKLAETETITYAIKARNVLNLLDLLPEIVQPPSINMLQDKPLTEQISVLENFVFFIRVYN